MGGVLVVAAVLAGLALALAVPVDVSFRLEGAGPVQGQIALGWAFGLARLRFRIPGAREPRSARAVRKAERKAARKRERPGRRRRRANVLPLLGQAPFRRRVQRLVADLVRAAHLRELRLRVRLGLGDPADTGRLWAFMGPLGALARSLPGAEVRLEPEFVEPVLELQAHGRLRLVPLQLLALAVAFALSPPSVRAWRSLLGSHA